MAIVTTGCPGPGSDPEPDPYKLSGVVADLPSGKSYTLKIVSYPADENGDEVVLASTAISENGSFSVDIPGRVDTRYLIPYNESSDWTYGLPHDGVTVSNGDVKFSATYMEVFAGSEYVGDIIYGKEEEGIYVAGFLFWADGDCNITGSYYNRGVDANAIYDLRVKKGWNWAYGTEKDGEQGEDDEIAIRSTAPSGLSFHLE
jgi:hypothetical protein